MLRRRLKWGTGIWLGALCLVATVAAPPSQALSLFFVTSTNNLNDFEGEEGEGELSVEVRVSGVSDPGGAGFLRGYDVEILFDSLVLTASDINANTSQFGGEDATVLDETVGAGTARAAVVVSSLDMSDAALQAVQGDVLILATMTFVVESIDDTVLAFGDTFLTDSDGLRAHDSSNKNLIPEPGTFLLVATGLGMMTRRRRRAVNGA